MCLSCFFCIIKFGIAVGLPIKFLFVTLPHMSISSGQEIHPDWRGARPAQYQWQGTVGPDRKTALSGLSAIPHNSDTCPCFGASGSPRWTARFQGTACQRADGGRNWSPKSFGISGCSRGWWSCNKCDNGCAAYRCAW